MATNGRAHRGRHGSRPNSGRSARRIARGVAPLAATVALIAAALAARTTLVAQEVAQLTPLSLRPGQTTLVTIQGQTDLVGPYSGWSSFGAKFEFVPPSADKDGKAPKADPKKLFVQVTPPADAPLGVGVVRLGTAKGVSEPQLLMVDHLPVAVKQGATSFEKPQTLAAPTAVEGFVDSRRPDYYRWEMKAGQSVSVEAFCVRLTSKLDPVLRLLDATGRELATVDDSPSLGGDGRLRYKAVEDGPVVLELRDVEYEGGRGHFYYLRIGDFPLTTAAFPPLALRGAEVEWRAAGEAVDGVPAGKTTAPAEADVSRPLTVRFDDARPAAFAELISSDMAPIVESEPNDAPEQANAMDLPGTFVGQFAQPRDRDVCQFPLKKNQKYRIACRMRSLGSPGELYVRVESAKGDMLFESDNQKPDEIDAEFTARDDGAGRVIVEELNRRGGIGQVYAVRIEPIAGTLELLATGERFFAAQGASFTVKVASKRRPGDAPITLELIDESGRPLEGWKCEDNVLEKGKNETQLKVTVPADAAPGSLVVARIVGRCQAKDVDYASVALQAPGNPRMRPNLAMLPRQPAVLHGSIAIGVGPREPAKNSPPSETKKP